MNPPDLESPPAPKNAASDRAAARGPARPAGPRSRWIVTPILAAVVVVLVLGVLSRRRALAATTEATRQANIPGVQVISVASSTTHVQLSLPATTVAAQRTVIQPRASGYVKRWLVDIGAKVTAGQVLAEIETPDLDQELLLSQADLEERSANLELAETHAKRFRQLLSTQAVAQQDVDDREAQLRSAEAERRAAQARLTRAHELMQFQKVTAPFDGVITARNVEVGDLVSATSGNSHGLFTLEQIDTLRVYVDVPQSQMRAIAPGLKAELRLREFPGRTFPAEVVRTAGALSPDSRTLRTELTVPNAEGLLLAGAFAQIRFSLPAPADVITVPVSSVMIRANGPQVAVVQPDDTIRLQSVTIGRDLGTELEILTGLQPAERVVRNPTDLLRNGTKVQIVKG